MWGVSKFLPLFHSFDWEKEKPFGKVLRIFIRHSVPCNSLCYIYICIYTYVCYIITIIIIVIITIIIILKRFSFARQMIVFKERKEKGKVDLKNLRTKGYFLRSSLSFGAPCIPRFTRPPLRRSETSNFPSAKRTCHTILSDHDVRTRDQSLRNELFNDK